MFDYIIVGGGSAGCVLANRLSANPNIRVLLVESGPDVADGRAPERILDSFAGRAFMDPRWIWTELNVSTDADAQSTPNGPSPKLRRYEQARVLGGGGSINGQLANRGAPDDYDEWEAHGATGWSWQTVLPYFKKLEHDTDFDGPLHGKSGPMLIRHIFPDQWVPHARAMAEGFEALGFKYLADQNGEFEDGYHPFAITNYLDRRVTPAIAYLSSGVRLRPNLEIRTNSSVTELVFDGCRCTGVTIHGDGRDTVEQAREVVVCSGAINTPALLMRSGIGPGDQLQALGIPVRADIAGVGKNLMDHPAVAIGSFVRPHARLGGKTRRHLLIGLRFSSGVAGTPPGDMAVSVSTKAAWHAVGEQIASVSMWVNKTYSNHGEVRLRSRDWRESPRVDFRLLKDPRDLERLMGAFRSMSRLFDVPAVREAVEDPFPASLSEKVRQVGVVNRKNAILTGILARLLDGPRWFRRLLMRNLVVEAPPLQDLLNDERMLEKFVRGAAFGVWHACGTCRMGAATDPLAVTDSAGRVRGVEGLRICDASLFPTIPRANIYLTVLMAAEKIADEILSGQGFTPTVSKCATNVIHPTGDSDATPAI